RVMLCFLILPAILILTMKATSIPVVRQAPVDTHETGSNSVSIDTAHSSPILQLSAAAETTAMPIASIGTPAAIIKGNDRVTAHRGSSKKAPENTLGALRLAISEGAGYAEIDVQETADGEI